jgi:hypothetical protein
MKDHEEFVRNLHHAVRLHLDMEQVRQFEEWCKKVDADPRFKKYQEKRKWLIVRKKSTPAENRPGKIDSIEELP